MGYALYSKKGRMYILEVLYEYVDSKFVGFRRKGELYPGEAYEIKLIDGELKIGKIRLTNEYRERVPVGKKYTQLPGGGGGFKESRKYNNIIKLFHNETIKGVLERFFGLQEVRKVVKENVSLLLEGKKKNKKEYVDFIGASIESKKDINKLEKIINNSVDIPKDWKKPLDFHMTITKDSGEEKMQFGDRRRIIGKDVKLKIVAIGKNETAIAFKEEGEMWSRKENKHITIAYEKAAQDADDIVDWEYFTKPIYITAIIRQIGYNKEIIHDIQLDERGSKISPGHFVGQSAVAGASRVFPLNGEYK